MPMPLIIVIPTEETELRDELIRGVEPYANVHIPQTYTDPTMVKLVLDIVGSGVGIAGGVAGILTFVRSLKSQKQAEGQAINIYILQSDGKEISPEDADEALLCRLLEQS